MDTGETVYAPFDTANYLTFTALENTFFFRFSKELEYAVNGINKWKKLAANTNSETISKGETISVRANLTPTMQSNSSGGVGKFYDTRLYCKVSGNPLSLLYGDNAAEQDSMPRLALGNLFSGMASSLKDASELNLSVAPSQECYYYMFNQCFVLTSPPVLPATTLAANCYEGMFNGCSGLTSTPELPATTLASGCYKHMFRDCTKLTGAPVLPATTLANICYSGMFYGCTGLTSAPELPATTLAEYCYEAMFRNCSKLISTPELPATTLATSCYQGMFYGCKGLTSAPEKLQATELVSYCYKEMFRSCTNLTRAPELPATTLVDQCYYGMFRDASKLNYIKALFLEIPTSGVPLTGWLSAVAATGTFVKNSQATWEVEGASGVPTGWTIEYADA